MIFNKTRKSILSKKYVLCSSFFLKSLGMMFRIRPKALIFAFEKEKNVPLHMLFVFFPIDVIYLDKNKKVVEIKKALKPFTFYKPQKKSKYVVELPAGAIQKSGTSLGDKIKF